MLTESNVILQQAQIITAIKKSRKELERSLCSVLETLLNSYREKQKRTEKGALANIYISLLRTAIPFEMPLYRIDFNDSQKQLDFIEHSAKWDIPFLSNLVYTDKFYNPNKIMAYSEEQHYINERNWFHNALLLHETLLGYMTDIGQGAAQSLDLEETGRIALYMGDYLGDSHFLCSLSKI